MSSDLMAVLLVGTSLVNLLLASFVWSRQEGRAGQALIGLMLASTLWSLSYSLELQSTGVLFKVAGDFKYVGIGALPVAWMIFALLWSGRDRFVTSRLVIALLIEPTLVLMLLANPGTHHLVRDFIDRGLDVPIVTSGPVFWFHLGYTMLMMVVAAVLFVAHLARRSHAYRAPVFVMTGGSLLPFMASIAFNLDVAPFNRFDYTPIALTLASAAITWGMLQQKVIMLAPVAYSQVVDGMADGVIVLDKVGNLVEANPAALAALGWSANSWRSKSLPVALASVVTRLGTFEVRLQEPEQQTVFEAQVTDLPAERGNAGGRLVVLRDISERRRSERQRATMLAEQARVAETLSRSLRPAQLPTVPGVALGAMYRPAGAGEEIGGDFYDVYQVGSGWAFALGDVSGKGARSAAVTALARYTLRALTRPEDPPGTTMKALNAQLLAETEDQEIYLTAVHGRLCPTSDGLRVTLSLGGHPRPFLVPASPDQPIHAVGEPGTAIGLLDEIETTDVEVMLYPGDALISYTDGVSEARAGREFFGEEGLAEVAEQLRGASAQTIAEGVLAAVLRYQDDMAADDIALLVVQAPGQDSEPSFDLPLRGPDALEDMPASQPMI